MLQTWAAPPCERSSAVRGARCGHDSGRLIGERQERLALGAVEMTMSVFANEKYDKGENETEADGEREWNDRHGWQGLTTAVEQD